MLEFENLEAAKRWYESEAYQEAKKLREGTAHLRVVAVQGVDKGVVPATCPLGRSRERYHGHSWTAPQATQPGMTHVSRPGNET